MSFFGKMFGKAKPGKDNPVSSVDGMQPEKAVETSEPQHGAQVAGLLVGDILDGVDIAEVRIHMGKGAAEAVANGKSLQVKKATLRTVEEMTVKKTTRIVHADGTTEEMIEETTRSEESMVELEAPAYSDPAADQSQKGVARLPGTVVSAKELQEVYARVDAWGDSEEMFPSEFEVCPSTKQVERYNQLRRECVKRGLRCGDRPDYHTRDYGLAIIALEEVLGLREVLRQV